MLSAYGPRHMSRTRTPSQHPAPGGSPLRASLLQLLMQRLIGEVSTLCSGQGLSVRKCHMNKCQHEDVMHELGAGPMSDERVPP